MTAHERAMVASDPGGVVGPMGHDTRPAMARIEQGLASSARQTVP
jgi:hypothetical protein